MLLFFSLRPLDGGPPYAGVRLGRHKLCFNFPLSAWTVGVRRGDDPELTVYVGPFEYLRSAGD